MPLQDVVVEDHLRKCSSGGRLSGASNLAADIDVRCMLNGVECFRFNPKTRKSCLDKLRLSRDDICDPKDISTAARTGHSLVASGITIMDASVDELGRVLKEQGCVILDAQSVYKPS